METLLKSAQSVSSAIIRDSDESATVLILQILIQTTLILKQTREAQTNSLCNKISPSREAQTNSLCNKTPPYLQSSGKGPADVR